MLLGWARGLLIDGDRMWVGFSRIRPTKIRENVGWVLRGLKRDFGTHVGCYDLRTRQFARPVRRRGLRPERDLRDLSRRLDARRASTLVCRGSST